MKYECIFCKEQFNSKNLIKHHIFDKHEEKVFMMVGANLILR